MPKIIEYDQAAITKKFDYVGQYHNILCEMILDNALQIGATLIEVSPMMVAVLVSGSNDSKILQVDSSHNLKIGSTEVKIVPDWDENALIHIHGLIENIFIQPKNISFV